MWTLGGRTAADWDAIFLFYSFLLIYFWRVGEVVAVGGGRERLSIGIGLWALGRRGVTNGGGVRKRGDGPSRPSFSRPDLRFPRGCSTPGIMSLRRPSSSWAQEANDDDSADRWEGLDEIVAPPPVQNPNESAIYRHRSLEETRREQREEGVRRRLSLASTATTATPRKRIATHIHTLSHLAFFSLLGTLARLGIQGLSSYPNAL